MKILVCAKVINGELNPFDESALECALSLCDDVTVITMGPESCREALKPLTRLGAKPVLISDSLFAGSDTLATSYILSTAIKQRDFDLILCGRQSIDGDTAQVGPMLATLLDLPLITNAISLKVGKNKLSAETRAGKETAGLPCLVTVERGYVLRFPSIFSKVSDIEMINNKNLNCDPSKCGLTGSPTRVLQTFENVKGKRNCKFINPKELLPLIESLKNKDSVKNKEVYTGKKLKSVWAVGDEVLPKAAEISDNVIRIEKTAPEEIAERAKKEKPGVILWNADLWGRKNAPVAAALMNTGLCADCTRLESDGENLIMYRPARGGNITAKIKCLTKLQMATVRTLQKSEDIVVAGGKGAADETEKLKSFAKSIGADIAASRGLVDKGVMPYDTQVGLTGKTISPKIYIAIGISGAVQHTCAIEGADTVIAINPDKDARIFEYSDYGIIMSFEDLLKVLKI